MINQVINQNEECVDDSTCSSNLSFSKFINDAFVAGSGNKVQQISTQENDCSQSICINGHGNVAQVSGNENLATQKTSERNRCSQSFLGGSTDRLVPI